MFIYFAQHCHTCILYSSLQTEKKLKKHAQISLRTAAVDENKKPLFYMLPLTLNNY